MPASAQATSAECPGSTIILCSTITIIEYAFRQGWLSDWEYAFSLRTRRKRRLSERQAQKRQEVNLKLRAILRHSREKQLQEAAQ
jgi:hypothetical protein